MNAGGIYNRNKMHTDDENFWSSFNKPDGIFKLICSAEEEWPFYFKYFNIFRNFVITYGAFISFITLVINLICQNTYITELYHFAHKKKCSENHSYFYCNGQINY